MPKTLPDKVSYKRSKDMFKVAFEGIVMAFKEEKNMRFDVLMGLIVLVAGVYFKITSTQWCILFLTIGVVLMAEIFNTAIENIVDFICPYYDLRAKKIKDLSCGAVLVICLSAIGVGLSIFIPYLL